MRSDRRRSTSAISAPAPLITMTHSSMEPSWLPHVPASLKISGLSECEFIATSFTDRSVRMNNHISIANENAQSSPCSTAMLAPSDANAFTSGVAT